MDRRSEPIRVRDVLLGFRAALGADSWKLQNSALVALAASFVTSKVVALSFGPAGVGYQSVVLATGSLVALIATWGSANAMPGLIGLKPHSGFREFARGVTGATLWTLPPVSAISLIIVAPQLMEAFDFWTSVCGILAGICAATIAAIRPTLLAVFVGSRTAASSQTWAAVTAAVTTVALLQMLPQEDLPLTLGLGQFFGQLVGWVRSAHRRHPSARAFGERVTAFWFIQNSWLVFSGTVLSAAVAGAVPLLVLFLSDAHTAGLVRAAMTLGGIPGVVLTSTVSLHFYPELSRANRERRATSEITQDAVWSTSLRVFSASAVLAAFAPIALALAYSDSFAAAAAALAFAATGGSVRILTLHNAYLLLASHRRAAYLATEALAGSVQLIVTLCGAAFASPTIVGTALLLSSGVHLLATRHLLKSTPDSGVALLNLGFLRITLLAFPLLMGMFWMTKF